MDKYLTSIDEFTSYDDVENQLAMIRLAISDENGSKEDKDKLREIENYLNTILVYLKWKQFPVIGEEILKKALEDINLKIRDIQKFIRNLLGLEYLEVPKDLDIPSLNNWLSKLFYLYKTETGKEPSLDDFKGIIPKEEDESELKNRIVEKYLGVFFQYNGKSIDRDSKCSQLLMSEEGFNNLIKIDGNGKTKISSDFAMGDAIKIFNQRNENVFKERFEKLNNEALGLDLDEITRFNIMDVKNKLESRMAYLMKSVNILTSNLKKKDKSYDEKVYDIIFSSSDMEIRNNLERDFLILEISNLFTNGMYGKMKEDDKDKLFIVLLDAIKYLLSFDVFKQVESDYSKYCKMQKYDEVIASRDMKLLEYEELFNELHKLEKAYVENKQRKISIIYSLEKKEALLMDLDNQIKKIKEKMSQIVVAMVGYDLFEREFITKFNYQMGFKSSVSLDKQELKVNYDYQQGVKNKNSKKDGKFDFKIETLEDGKVVPDEKLFMVFPFSMLPPSEEKINDLPMFREFGIKMPNYGSQEFRILYEKIVKLLNNSFYSDSLTDGKRILSNISDDRLIKIHNGKFDTLISTVKASEYMKIRK